MGAMLFLRRCSILAGQQVNQCVHLSQSKATECPQWPYALSPEWAPAILTGRTADLAEIAAPKLARLLSGCRSLEVQACLVSRNGASSVTVVVLFCPGKELSKHILLRWPRWRWHVALLVVVHTGRRMVVAVHAEARVLLALLAKELAERELASHGRRRCCLDLVAGSLFHAALARLLLGLAARSCPVCNGHHLLGSLRTAVGSRGGRRVGEDPQAVDLVALQDDIGIGDLHVLAAGELEVEVVEAAAVEDDGAVPLGADGRGRQLADEERALDADLLPLLRVEVEGVERGIGRRVLDGEKLGVDAAQDGEVELFVGARRRQRHVERGQGRVRLVVGRLWRGLGLVLVLVAARLCSVGGHGGAAAVVVW
jgi:hypothetical protein